jgi:hypothetical protein
MNSAMMRFRRSGIERDALTEQEENELERLANAPCACGQHYYEQSSSACQDSRKKDLHGNVSAWVDGRIRQVMPWFLAIAIDDFYRATFVARYGRPWGEDENGERLCCNIRKWRSLT